ncbi:hypothetical protein BM1374166_02126 [Bartonella tribocorum]|nr:hypothetical protein BM1374166_02126 [Bartonella tribocorum]
MNFILFHGALSLYPSRSPITKWTENHIEKGLKKYVNVQHNYILGRFIFHDAHDPIKER